MQGKYLKEFEIKKNRTEFVRTKINNSRAAADYMKQFYGDDMEIFESAFILLLNQANMTIGYAKISQGGVSGTTVDPLIIAKYAVDVLAKRVIIAHNHPSGNLTPSPEDITFSQNLKKGLEFLKIDLTDSIILTADSYFSLADEGRL